VTTPHNQTVLKERQFTLNCSVEEEREKAGVRADLTVPREKEDHFFGDEGDRDPSKITGASCPGEDHDQAGVALRAALEEARPLDSEGLRRRALERARLLKAERTRQDRTA
jgi:hypothetical protein